ncbi:hypothetical protein K2173_010282 [Erythroxylum novogranatense]|uniref:Calcineurin B-like protein n=1 Tax=Erythroxylum novogranatense TaxID=1862640 RepID=A0AAV8TD64_9ROSI|nr:hypothetical protein K2173_010282 [Erythroxylum novogranatense]
MGCNCVKHLKSERRNDLATKTCFNEAEIGALYELFRKLSSSITDDGLISKEEFWIGLFRINKKQSLLADRIFQLFDFKHDGVIDFEEFVLSLNVFHPEAPQAEKVAFSFHLYDICQTGYIQQKEVKQLILALLDESDLTFPDDVIEAIIRKTFMDVDKKGDGKIDVEEWKEFVIHNPLLLKHMTVPYLKTCKAGRLDDNPITETQRFTNSFKTPFPI